MEVVITVKGKQGAGKSQTLGKIMLVLRQAGVVAVSDPVVVEDPLIRPGKRKTPRARATFTIPDIGDGHTG